MGSRYFTAVARNHLLHVKAISTLKQNFILLFFLTIMSYDYDVVAVVLSVFLWLNSSGCTAGKLSFDKRNPSKKKKLQTCIGCFKAFNN